MPRHYPHLNEEFFRRLLKEISRVEGSFNYNYICDDKTPNPRYPLCHFIYTINEARKRNPRTKYTLRYAMNDGNLSFRTLTVQTSTVNGLVEIGVPKKHKEIAKTIYDEYKMGCKYCKNVNETTPHPDYDYEAICDKCLLLRNHHLIKVTP